MGKGGKGCSLNMLILGSIEVPEGQAAESPKVCVGWDGDVVTLDLVTAVSLGFVPAHLEFCIEHSGVGLFCLDI